MSESDRRGITWTVIDRRTRLKTNQKRWHLPEVALEAGWTVAEWKAVILQRHRRVNDH